MPDIEILNQMIKDGAKLILEMHNEKTRVTLIEPQCDKSSVSISGLPENAIVIKVDAFRSPDTMFAGSKGECKRADYVIVADTGNKKVILCIEMKLTKGSEKEIIQQLTGACCFVSYCQEIGRAFWQRQDFLKGYAYRFVSIDNISIAKQKTRMNRQGGTHDRPDRMLKIDWPHHLQFSHLVGGG